jgi:hypothetical protein
MWAIPHTRCRCPGNPHRSAGNGYSDQRAAHIYGDARATDSDACAANCNACAANCNGYAGAADVDATAADKYAGSDRGPQRRQLRCMPHRPSQVEKTGSGKVGHIGRDRRRGLSGRVASVGGMGKGLRLER